MEVCGIFVFFGDYDICKPGQALYIQATKTGYLKVSIPLALGHPIGASSNPVGTRFSAGKSSVLYLCFRLTLGRGCLRHLQPGQMGSGQTLFGGSRAGGFCVITDKIGICTEGKIRLTGKGGKGILSPVPPQRSLVSLLLPWISRGSYRHYTGSCTVGCKRLRWTGCPGTPSGSACTGAGAGHRPPA